MSGTAEAQGPEPRPAPVAAAPATPVGLDHTVLPAGTTLRFLVLFVAMMVATVQMVSSMMQLLPYEDVATLCDFASGYDPGSKLVDDLVRYQAQEEAVRACAEGGEGVPAWFALAGSGVVLLAAGGLYLLLPRWKRRRRGVEPLHTRDPLGEVRAEIVRLAERAGVRRLPDLVVDRLTLDPGAVVYGRAGRRTLCLYSGLLHTRRTDPARFEAVVLHELAHLRHRDVDIAFAVTALWRVFLALVVVPHTLLVGGTLAAAQFFGVFHGLGEVYWPANRPSLIKAIIVAAFLFLLIVLARADTLRHRELYADRAAVALGADRAVWQARAAGHPGGRPAVRTVMALWSSHPSPAARWRSLGNPAALFALTDVPLFLLGVTTLVTGNALSGVWDGLPAAWVVGSLAACVLTVAVWRAVLYAVHGGAPGPRGVRAGFALGLGLVCGELFAGSSDGAGWWPDHLEPLLFPLLGSVVFVTWLTQCARLHLSGAPSPRAGYRRTLLAGAVAGSVVAAAGLSWWLGSGQLWMTGDVAKANGFQELVRQRFPAPGLPHYESVLPWISSVIGGLSSPAASPTVIAGAVVLWLYPAALLLRRPKTEGLRATVLWGLVGGLGGVAAVAAAMAYVDSWRPPLDDQTSGFGLVYLWWQMVALWAGVVLTAAVVAATARRNRLPRALTAAAIAQVIELAGQLVLQAADGCIGPLRVMGNTCHVLPGTSWLLTAELVPMVLPAFFGAALAATAVAHLRREGAARVLSGPVGRARPARAVVAAAALAGITVTAVVTSSGHGDGGALALTPTVRPAADTKEKVRDFQLLAWYAVSGKSDIRAQVNRYAELAQWFEDLDTQKSGFDDATLRPVCSGLARDTTGARHHLRVPDPGLDGKWSRLLDRAGDAAEECEAVLDGPGDDVDRNTRMLESLASMLKGAEDVLSPMIERISTALDHWPQWKAG